MHEIRDLFTALPLLALLVTISLGYLLGKFRIKNFVLGGIAGSLLVGVVIGQLDIKLPSAVGSIFFALFIYAVGYQGGPQFFRSLRKDTAIQLVSAVITCLLGLACVLAAAWYFNLDRGTAAGLAAGGLTQSAVIGTATDALSKLGLEPAVAQTLQNNVAVGYAVTYIFGSFGPILMLATVFPLMMGWNLRSEAKKLAERQQSGEVELEPGQFNALRPTDTRIYYIDNQSPLVGQTAKHLFASDANAAVEAIIRDGQLMDLDPKLKIQQNDVIAITARPEDFVRFQNEFGNEIAKPTHLQLIEEVRQIILTNKKFDNRTIKQCLQDIDESNRYGIFITSVSHLGEKVAADDTFTLRKGDELEVIGRTDDLDKISSLLGSKITAAKITDFIFFGMGMALGYLIGLLSFSIWGVSVTLGSGVGCLFSGLIFGWLHSTYPQHAALPTGASNFLRDFGLAVFVASIGITAGPQAINTIKEYGLELFFIGIGVTIIPQILTFYISYYLLKIKNPIILLATIAGGRSANPGFAALLDKAGNSTPVVPFTATYAVANILLTLWGPIVVSLVTINS